MRFRYLKVTIFLISISIFLVQCSAPSEPATSQPAEVSAPAPELAPVPPTEVAAAQVSANAQQLVDARCSACHTTDRVKSAKMTPDEWATNVKRMVGKGAQLNPEEQQIVVKYLTETYPK